jgi:hypothetical protein
MQFGAKPPLGVIYDTSFGDSPEDAEALRLLYSLAGKNECRVAAVSVSKPNLKAAIAADIIARAAGASPRRALPIGLASSGPGAADTPLLDSICDGKSETAIQSLNDTAEPHALIRNALTAQHDQNAAVVCCGRLSNLRLTLDLPGARTFIEQKSRILVIAAGDFSGNPVPDPNIAIDIPAARRVLADWPGPIVLVSRPVEPRYQSAILHAVRPAERASRLSEPGAVEISPTGLTTFNPSPSGRHRLEK